MNWIAFGYCVVAAIILAGVVALCVSGIRALLRRSMAFFLMFTAASSLTTITAQKTNNVPPNMNAPLPQMQQGGGSFQAGFTGLSGSLPNTPTSLNPVNLVNPVQNNIPVQTTDDDISRGWRVESVTTNAVVSYAMPTNATLVGNWHIHGARSSFGNNRIDFGDWRFPLGTNNEAFLSFWYFIDGRIRPTPRDAAHEICAVGVPMAAVPGQSRLWRLDGDDGSRVLTWENFFLGGDTNCPINAQIVLSPNGDFITRTNEVETVCRRVNPDDWDDDGIPNDEDANPPVCDGDFFGPSNILPAGANTNAYCTISVVATGSDALVTFAGDKPCNYPDPRFVAKSGVTNEVVILIGKTYAISSDWPFAVVGVSDPDTEVWQVRGAAHQTYACRPVTISASDGNPFTMSVVPLNLGGVFLWPSAQCSCSISGIGDTFTWNCPMGCTCCGCSVEGQYSYEGYWLPAMSCLCGCYYDGTGPKWEPSSAPLAASVSASFSKSAVIFEDAYENQPGQWVGKNSTRTRLNIVANGGPNGGTLSVTSANLAKLTRISGPDLPLASVAVPAETQVSYAVVYEGDEASEATNDICVVATFAESAAIGMLCATSMLTSIQVALTAHFAAPSNSCMSRHVFGVNEWVHIARTPTCANVAVSIDGDSTLVGADGDQFWCPWEGGLSELFFASDNAVLISPVRICEPQPRAIYAEWNGELGTNGCAGQVGMNLVVAVYPMTVSFFGIYMEEIPDEAENCPRFGYFSNAEIGRPWSHTTGAGAGIWTCVNSGNIWTGDRVGTGRVFPAPWSDGWKEWDIPIGWGAYESGAYRVKGTCQPSPTTQRFEIDSQGAVTIRKFSHSVKRTIDNKVWLDDVRVN